MQHRTQSPRPRGSRPWTRWAGIAAVALSAAIVGDASGRPWHRSTRFNTHVSTDKPIYRPGEHVWARAVLLDAVDHHAAPNWIHGQVQVLSPGGSVVWQQWVRGTDSVLGAGWKIPRRQAGGEYTLKVRVATFGVPVAERKFQIRNFRQRRLKTQLEFVRKGYGPGDTASAVLKVERAEGGIPAGARVSVVARVDGAAVHRGTARVDERGHCSVSFRLPETIDRGEGTLALVIHDGGVVETAAKTIPILLRSLDLTAYPEGGELVAGVPCGLYLQARTPWGDPADVTAEIVDDRGTYVHTFVTKHEGRGRAEFTPQPGRRYFVRISRPAGITSVVKLPAPVTDGVSLRARERAYLAGEPVSVRVTAATSGTYRVTLARADVIHSNIPIDLAAGEANVVTFHPAARLAGVLRLTVFDADGKPRAERLVFRHGDRDFTIAIEADASSYVPGAPVTLKIRTTDRYGKAISAVVGLTVTDDAVLEMIERRKQAPRLPQMVFLEPDVQRLDDAQIYLQPGSDAAIAVDLLLGTQGWRRFAFEDPASLIQRHGALGRRVLAHNEMPVPQPTNAPGGRVRLAGGMGGVVARARGGKGAPAHAAEGAPDAPVGADRPQNAPERQDRPERELHALQKKIMEKEEFGRDELDDKDWNGRLAKPKADRRQVAYRRVYAHAARPGRKPGERVDFAETLYWAAGIRTNAAGEAQVQFGLSDAVTSFRVMADGWSNDGRLGSADLLLESRQPLFVEPKIPLEVTAGDRILLPIAAVNATATALELTIAGQAGAGLTLPKNIQLDRVLEADSRGRLYLPVQVTQFNGRTRLTLAATAGAYSDTVTRTITVRPYGFPMELSGSGLLQGTATHAITVPAEVEMSSIETEVKLYPTPLANLTEALRALIREPYGCFEQTSSVSYPMVMAQRYFTSHTGVDPALIAKAQSLIDKSYKRLAGFECKKGGFSWFGRDPAHECLTAYGVLQFHDMQQVYDGVSAAMLDRTIGWLMNRRNKQGGFDLNPRFLHNWGCPDHVANAYILWALTESGEANAVKAQVDALIEQALEKPDAYFRALLALCCYNVERTKDGDRFAQELVRSQTDEGWVKDAATTVVASRGRSLQVETTALAVMAWLRNDAFAGNVEKAMRWLLKQNQGGRFGSTQATVLALRALVERDARHARPKKAGTVTLVIDGTAIGTVPFATDTQGVIALPDFRDRLTPGQHTIELRMADGAPMPYSLQIKWFARKPDSSANCALSLTTALAATQVPEGETVEVNVTVRNTTDTEQPMPMAIIGLPGGLEPRHEQLKELVEAGTLAYYEVRGRDVVAYFSKIDAGQSIRFRVDCVAAVPGEYTGDASRAYLYYGDEDKVWVGGLKVKITAR